MKTLNIIVSSKTKNSLNHFFSFLHKNSLILSFNIINKKFQKKMKKTVITILKSPHVNKTAQEQFEIRYISKQIQIRAINLFKFLIFFKKLKVSLLTDINIKIIVNTKNSIETQKKNLNIDNLYYKPFFFEQIHSIQNNKLKKNRNILLYNNEKLINLTDSLKILKLFDIYGNY